MFAPLALEVVEDGIFIGAICFIFNCRKQFEYNTVLVAIGASWLMLELDYRIANILNV